MEISFRKFLVVSLAAAVVLLYSKYNVVSAEDVDSQVIRDACKVSLHPDFCFSTLSSDERSRGKTFAQLSYLSIVLSNEKAKEGRSHVSDVLKQTTEPLVKKILNYCSGEYDNGVVQGTAEALKEFNNFQYRSAGIDVSACIAALNNCDNAFLTPGAGTNVIGYTNQLVAKYCLLALDFIDYFENN